MSSPELPEGYRSLRTVHRAPHHALVQAAKGDARFVVRTLNLPREHAPALDPSMMLMQLGKIPKGLELRSFAQLEGASSQGDRITIIEAFEPGDPIAGATFEALTGLRQLLEDLAKLHQHGKWHGGVRPPRILLHEGELKLCGFASACWLSASPPSLQALLEPQAELAPELVGPSADVFGLCKSLLKVRGLPPALKASLQAGCAEDPTARPTIRALLARFD